MDAVIVGYAMAAFLLAIPLLGRNRIQRQAVEADEQRAVDLRRYAESRWTNYLLASWSLLSAVGGAFLLVRGHSIGWAWFGVAVAYALGIVAGRWSSRRVLATLGDRGRVERAARYRSRAARSHRWAAVGFTAYIGTKIVRSAYPSHLPDVAVVAVAGLALVVVIGGLGFLTIRTRMYLQGDDLEPSIRP